MRQIIVFFIMLTASCCLCQNGFIRSYDFDMPAAVFTNMLLKEDTLIVTGLILPDEPPFLQGILFAKLDTFGNVLEYKAHFDSLGNNYVVGTIPSGFLMLSDHSGYLILGGIFELNQGIVMKLDVNGNIVFVKEYPDNLSLTDFYKKPLELPNGFFITGDKFYNPGEAEVFIMKIDKDGNKLWEKKHGSLAKYDGFSDIIQTSPNEFVVAAIRNSLQNVPWQQAEYKKWVFAVDSLGNFLWQWESEHSLEEIGINNLYKNEDGNWVYTTTNNIVEIDGYMRTQPRFVIRDSNFDIVSSKLYDIPDYDQNYFERMIPVPDGGWLAVGRDAKDEPLPIHLYGWLYRLDEDGDSLWSRSDTAIWGQVIGTGNSLNSVVILPSGSIMAAGICEVFHPQSKDYGWLIKIDRHGCIDTINCTPLSSAPIKNLNKTINVFPNPTNSIVNYISEEVEVWDKVDVLNSIGQVVMTLEKIRNNQLDIKALESGIYYLRFCKSNQYLVKKIIKT